MRYSGHMVISRVAESEYEKAILDAGVQFITHYRGDGGYNSYPVLLQQTIEGKGVEKSKTQYSLMKKYSFSIPSEECLQAIKALAPIIEVGCGSGYWAYELRKRGCDIIATDKQQRIYVKESGRVEDKEYGFYHQWVPSIERISALEAIEKYPDRTLMISWPSYGENWAAQAIKAYRGKNMVYIGEWGEACGDDEMVALMETLFDDETSRRIDIPRWYGSRDHAWVLERKE